MMLKKIKLIFILFLIAALAGCANIFTSKPPQLIADIQAVNYLNPNVYRRPSPVVIVIYQLKSITAFKQANFFALYNNAVQTLGNDLLDRRELEVRPQQKISIPQNRVPNTNYIGILAAFRNPDRAQWKKIIQLPAQCKSANIDIHLAAQSISAKLKD